ncbi:hypothetical protein [[Bacillus] enclensis]|uniref:hypothetical protein n=1 Tax=[Bacillus] enclensis TaxID=1402860 RepID=UPI0018DB5FD1|nr:hypothetical protein [[Bacillus] enclensis]MBH9968153.1 hypothetical protein [[Bacillus] enclensis]
MMKKLGLSLLVSLLMLSILGNTAFASSSSTAILSEVEDISKESNSIELVDYSELPEGTPLVEFDTVEEFEKAVKDLEEEQEGFVNEKYTTLPTRDSGYFATAAASRTDRLKVYVKRSWNPLKSMTQPTYITVDLRYSYSGSKFTKINGLSSFSPGYPTDWIQTSKNTSLYNSNRSVSAEVNGYNLLGVSIGGQPVGAKIADTVTFKYTKGGTKTLFE